MRSVAHNVHIVPYGGGDGLYRAKCHCGWQSSPGIYFDAEKDGKFHIKVVTELS